MHRCTNASFYSILHISWMKMSGNNNRCTHLMLRKLHLIINLFSNTWSYFEWLDSVSLILASIMSLISILRVLAWFLAFLHVRKLISFPFRFWYQCLKSNCACMIDIIVNDGSREMLCMLDWNVCIVSIVWRHSKMKIFVCVTIIHVS